MRKNRRRYNQLIAVNLIEKMKQFEQNPPPIKGFTISRMQYLIHLILSHKQDNHPGSYSLLHMPYLLNMVPESHKYLNFLKDENIIEWVNHSAGRNSRMYRLVDEGKTEYRIIIDKKLIRRIEQTRLNIKKQNSRKYPELNHYIHQVRINSTAALKTVESEYYKNLKSDPSKAEGRRTFSLSEIEKIQSGEIYIKCNRTNGRLDSNYTRLPGELLQHLTIDGKLLTELDICNSQPFFAASLLNPTAEVNQLISKFSTNSLTMLAKSLQISECNDVKLYTQLVTNCNFYDPFLMQKCREYKIPIKSRDELKEQLFIIYFGKNGVDKYNNAAKLFKMIFPNVYNLFKAIKEDNHNQLAILLQRLESYTMLERVAQKILIDLPGLPFITIHDSLLPSGIMVIDQENTVKEIMLSTIKEVTGLTPVIRIKNGTEKTQIRPRSLLTYNLTNLSIYLLLLISMLGFPL